MALNLRQFREKIRSDLKRFEKKAISRALMVKLGKLTKDIIFKRTKAGFGVRLPSDGKNRRQRIKPLSSKYIEQRKRLGVRGRFGTVRRSNLTFTGQLLDSLTLLTRKTNFVLMIPSTIRDDGLTNKEVGDDVQKERPFFDLTFDEAKILQKEFIRHLDRQAKIFKRT